MTKYSPFRYFKTSPEITRLAVMLFVRFSLSLRDVEDLLHELGIFVVVGKLSKNRHAADAHISYFAALEY